MSRGVKYQSQRYTRVLDLDEPNSHLPFDCRHVRVGNVAGGSHDNVDIPLSKSEHESLIGAVIPYIYLLNRRITTEKFGNSSQ